jgi:hypothetical protein
LSHESTQLLPELIGQFHFERRHNPTIAPTSDGNKDGCHPIVKSGCQPYRRRTNPVKVGTTEWRKNS